MKTYLFKNQLISETPLETIDLIPKIGVIIIFLRPNIGSGKMGPRDREKMRVRAEKMHVRAEKMHVFE